MDSEWIDYATPDLKATWKLKKEKGDRQVWKKDFKKLGIQSNESTPCFALIATIPTSLESVYQFCHERFLEESPKWIPTLKSGEIVERIPGASLSAAGIDEVVVNYVKHKLPLVDDRDFLYFTFVRRFTSPNPRTPGNPTPTHGVMIGNVSTTHPQYASPPGFTRAEILKGFVVIQEVPGNPHECTYWSAQQLDLHGKIPKKLANMQQSENMLDQLSALVKALTGKKE